MQIPASSMAVMIPNQQKEQACFPRIGFPGSPEKPILAGLTHDFYLSLCNTVHEKTGALQA
jgi:hypothetical protein